MRSIRSVRPGRRPRGPAAACGLALFVVLLFALGLGGCIGPGLEPPGSEDNSPRGPGVVSGMDAGDSSSGGSAGFGNSGASGGGGGGTSTPGDPLTPPATTTPDAGAGERDEDAGTDDP